MTMEKKIFAIIAFFFMVIMLVVSCSQDDNNVLNSSVTSTKAACVENNVVNDYAELGKIPEESAKVMDEAEREAWQKLSTKYYIKKNVFHSAFYQKHKAEILKRISFLYDYAVKKNAQPSYLSFIWAEKEITAKAMRLFDDNDSTATGGSSTDIDADSGYVDSPSKKEYYATVTCEAYNYNGIRMEVSLPYKVTEDEYRVTIEATGSSSYEVYPVYASFSGSATIDIEENVACCWVYGDISYYYRKYNVNYYSTCDLLKHFKETKPQC